MNDQEKKYFSVDVRRLVLGVFYFILIGVVLYGKTDHVYDGFGNAVPWIIIVLFAFMGVMRIAEAFAGINVLEWLRDCGSEQNEDAGSSDKE